MQEGQACVRRASALSLGFNSYFFAVKLSGRLRAVKKEGAREALRSFRVGSITVGNPKRHRVGRIEGKA